MDPLLKLEGLTVHFSGLKALTDVSFDTHAGEVRAVIGPNGAGKTTLFNAISGYVQPTVCRPTKFRVKGCAGLSKTAGYFPS